MSSKCIVGRPINGISINGLEYITDDNGDIMVFDNEEKAMEYLVLHGYTTGDVEDFGIIFEKYEEK